MSAGAERSVAAAWRAIRRRLASRWLGTPWTEGRAKRLVGAGYDAMAAAYAAWAGSGAANRRRELWAAALGASLPPGSAVLDLGCGSGAEVEGWAARGLAVTGVDLSEENVRLARQRVSGARFVHADMERLDLPAGGFDAVTAFYSLIHVPRRQQPGVMARVHTWLRPGGLFLANLASRPFSAFYDPLWLGVPMYWSSLGSDGAQRALGEAGFDVVRAEHWAETDFGRRNTFLWVAARKGGGGEVGGTSAASRFVAALDRGGEAPQGRPEAGGGHAG